MTLLVGLTLEPAASDCTRAELKSVAYSYLSSAVAGKMPANIATANFTCSEADEAIGIIKGILAHPINFDFNRTFIDTIECAAFVKLNAAGNKVPYATLARVYLPPSNTSKISSTQSVVPKSGNWAFSAADRLTADKPKKWDAIPDGKHDTREVMTAAADVSWVTVPRHRPLASRARSSQAAPLRFAGSVGQYMQYATSSPDFQDIESAYN
ncbi:hypothetical protein F503_01340 [Ophiostoma piceae UAMH 11346]|uniref:Uncharacterized protein n=1 Tax=Ophiostoma piceae (strain UAMH 11346) TaxID=1262450 RepID=S3BY03_OPHP1|nr:hypothetical protein F503_01340 [Ophiostoma piceae UAMH 11346]